LSLYRTIAIAIGATALSGGLALGAWAQEIQLKFQSADQAGNPNFVLQNEWAQSVEEKTDGAVSIELLPVGSVVEYNETLDAVGAGILDGQVTDSSYFAGKDAAFSLIGNPVGAYGDPEEMFGFFERGGGAELMRELYEPYGIYFIGPSTPGLEAFVSKVPLEGVDDLQGLKMRAPEGLVQKVFEAAGASPVALPSSEVFTSLDKGVVDAADFSVFSTNQAQGLHDIAPNPVYPGFHSMPLIEISMNLDRWNSLDAETQEAITESVREFSRNQVAALREKDLAAVEEAQAGGEVTVTDWSDEDRARFRSIAAEQWQDVASQSENAQKVYDTLTAYLQSEGLIAE
jgi:TRAP-type C4-dicarboxylate transport system substrate-binding protein